MGTRLRKNKVGSLIHGFDYQELWALKTCIDWLQTPSLYKHLQFETRPSDSNEQEFYLDDIIVRDSSDKLLSFQIKHSDNPKEEISFSDLLKDSVTPKGKPRPSLLHRWINSFLSSDALAGGTFITNRLGAADLTSLLVDQKLDWQRISEADSPDAQKLIGLFPDDSARTRFLESFSFVLGGSRPAFS